MKSYFSLLKSSEDKKFDSKFGKLYEDFERFQKRSIDYIRENLKLPKPKPNLPLSPKVVSSKEEERKNAKELKTFAKLKFNENEFNDL